MITYWLQNGETFTVNRSIKDILEPLFQHSGEHTQLSRAFFNQLNVKNLDDLAKRVEDSLEEWKNGKEPCSICGNPHTDKVKQWLCPFIIAMDKFPNLHPNGKVDSLHICKGCAEKSIRAYGRILFNGQKNYLCFMLFFATNSDELKRFYNMQQTSPIPNFYRNWSDKLPDIIYYPYEFLAYVLYNISIKLQELEDIDMRLGAMVFGLFPGSKKIFDTADIVDNLTPIIIAFKRFSDRSSQYDGFNFLFQRLREDGEDAGSFIKRNLFFKALLKDKKIDWHTLENILFYNISLDRNVPFINPFLLTIMEELHMKDREIFEQISSVGYTLGMHLLNKSDKDKAKRYLYELRRKRRLEEFLDAINLIQLEVERSLDDRPFKENPEMFPKLKVFFLIGMTNAIFKKGEDNEG